MEIVNENINDDHFRIEPISNIIHNLCLSYIVSVHFHSQSLYSRKILMYCSSITKQNCRENNSK